MMAFSSRKHSLFRVGEWNKWDTSAIMVCYDRRTDVLRLKQYGHCSCYGSDDQPIPSRTNSMIFNGIGKHRQNAWLNWHGRDWTIRCLAEKYDGTTSTFWSLASFTRHCWSGYETASLNGKTKNSKFSMSPTDIVFSLTEL